MSDPEITKTQEKTMARLVAPKPEMSKEMTERENYYLRRRLKEIISPDPAKKTSAENMKEQTLKRQVERSKLFLAKIKKELGLPIDES